MAAENNNPLSENHGGNIDYAIEKYGGFRDDWIDLSTGINSVPYPIQSFDGQELISLPTHSEIKILEQRAREFWRVPSKAQVVATSGASQIIALLPLILHGKFVSIPNPTYNEYEKSFLKCGWKIVKDNPHVKVLVHPNNPTGYIWDIKEANNKNQLIVDESFCDVAPAHSFVSQCLDKKIMVLKSFGKFWGLAGLRLGFIIGGDPCLSKFRDLLGPWPVSGAAIKLGSNALRDKSWVEQTRIRLENDSKKLDELLTENGAKLSGGCSLFRLYEVEDAHLFQDKLAKFYIWSRIFSYSTKLVRLGIPSPNHWQRLERAVLEC